MQDTVSVKGTLACAMLFRGRGECAWDLPLSDCLIGSDVDAVNGMARHIELFGQAIEELSSISTTSLECIRREREDSYRAVHAEKKTRRYF